MNSIQGDIYFYRINEFTCLLFSALMEVIHPLIQLTGIYWTVLYVGTRTLKEEKQRFLHRQTSENFVPFCYKLTNHRESTF